MKIILFGATGMVGQGVLAECLNSLDVEIILCIVRRPSGKTDPKLRELVHRDFANYSAIEENLAGYDACFFCLGVSSLGMSAEEYARVTFGFTLAAARTLARLNPGMTFVYVSGTGTDSSEQGSSRWARVKGRTENALFALPFRAVYAFRPAYIQPLGGIVARTAWLKVLYALVAPLYPVWNTLFSKYVTTTRQMGLAMLHVVRQGAPKRVLETPDINEMG